MNSKEKEVTWSSKVGPSSYESKYEKVGPSSYDDGYADIRMDPIVKAAWTEKLLSGEYSQTRAALKRIEDTTSYKSGHCCLGVLCEVAVEQNVGRWSVENKGRDNVPFISNGESHHGQLNQDVLIWAGMGNSSLGAVPGLFDKRGNRVYLADLNDDDKMTFSQIADVINYFF